MATNALEEERKKNEQLARQKEEQHRKTAQELERQIEKLEDVDKIEEIREINKKLDEYDLGMDQMIKPKGALHC